MRHPADSIATKLPYQTIDGPGRLELILDASEIFPANPGLGTPALVIDGEGTATFDAALGEGETDEGPLDVEQQIWLEEVAGKVNGWLEYHFAAALRASQDAWK